MSVKKFMRAGLVSLIAGLTVGTAAFSACTIETSHPEIVITVSFNNEEYELEYQLYRNMYPQTVKHFIELADGYRDDQGNQHKFFDNTIIHNYTANDWFGGGYKYDESYASAYATAGELAEYFMETASLEATYYNDYFLGEHLTPSVYKTYKVENNKYVGETALPTLIGEFSKNDHSIKNGSLNNSYGALRMYYNDDKAYAGKTGAENVWVNNTTDNESLERDYKYNSATSLFSIQTGSSSSLANDSYCTFGKLTNEDALDDLLDAIADYIDENLSGSSFTKEVEVIVDTFEQFADKGNDVSYNATALPIIIKTVKVTKY